MLFCEISPLTYQVSVLKCRMMRNVRDAFSGRKFAQERLDYKLPFIVYKHNSLIRRRLGNVNMKLQDNKAVNLGISAPKVTNVIIKPGETFSFWKLVGKTKAKYGYMEGLQISSGKTSSGIGGGMCQFTNLIHWMVLHSPLEVVERHHHDKYDLFPDYNRQVPFGVGTSIFYNYLDYRFFNPTDITFMLVVYTTEEYLCGELLADKELSKAYHIKSQNDRFIKEDGKVYRCGTVLRNVLDKETGNVISKEVIGKNHAEVLYDTSNLKFADE